MNMLQLLSDDKDRSKNTRIFIMHNKETNVTIQCTEDYIVEWMSRGFEIIGAKNV